MKIVIPILVIVVAVITLITVSVMSLGYPEVQVGELLRGDFAGQFVKVHGTITAIHSEARPLSFDIRDKQEADQVLTVEVDTVRPDLFKIDNQVAVEGTYDPVAGRMAGTKIYTKCPSKYEAAQDFAPAGD